MTPVTEPHGEEPLVEAEDVRVDVDGVPTCDGISLRTRGDRALVLRAPSALFEAAAGIRPVVRGSLRVRGRAPGAAVRARSVASVAFDGPLPPRWKALEYVTWSARLSGLPKREAARLARDAIDRLRLGAFAKTPLGRATTTARRAVALAAAMATGARTLLLADPLVGLADDEARAWANVLVEALADRSWAAFAPRIPLTSALATVATDALIVSASRLEAQGSPTELGGGARRLVARVHGRVDVLADKLEAVGARIDEQAAGGSRILLDLGETLSTTELFALCSASEVAVIELYPLARALE